MHKQWKMTKVSFVVRCGWIASSPWFVKCVKPCDDDGDLEKLSQVFYSVIKLLFMQDWTRQPDGNHQSFTHSKGLFSVLNSKGARWSIEISFLTGRIGSSLTERDVTWWATRVLSLLTGLLFLITSQDISPSAGLALYHSGVCNTSFSVLWFGPSLISRLALPPQPLESERGREEGGENSPRSLSVSLRLSWWVPDKAETVSISHRLSGAGCLLKAFETDISRGRCSLTFQYYLRSILFSSLIALSVMGLQWFLPDICRGWTVRQFR